MTTANTLVSGALRVISSNEPGEGVPGDEAENALTVLNRMLKAWSASNLVSPCRTLESVALPIGYNSITIGSTGQMVVTRPDYVTNVFLRDSANVDATLAPMSKETYNAIPIKNTSAKPTWYYFDPQFPNATLYFDSATGEAYTLFVESIKPFNQFTTLQTDMNLPGEYEEAIVYLLAQRLAPEYGFSIAGNPDIAVLVRNAEAFIMRKNVAPVQARFEAGLDNNGFYDITSGGVWS